MSEEVHIIKIGEVIRILSDGKSIHTLLTIEENYAIPGICSDVKSYVDILKESIKDRYNVMNTNGIIRQPTFSRFGNTNNTPFFGISDGDPIVGKSFTINNSYWHTSEVLEIINENIIITKNSVYLIFSKSKEREKKLNNLGI